MSLELQVGTFPITTHCVFGFWWSRHAAGEDEKLPPPQSLLAAVCSHFQLHLPGHFLPGFLPSPLDSLLLFIFSFHLFPFLSHSTWGKKYFHFPCRSPAKTLRCLGLMFLWLLSSAHIWFGSTFMSLHSVRWLYLLRPRSFSLART